MKFRCEDKRPAQLEDLNSTTESHRTVITSSGFVSTVHSINLYFFFPCKIPLHLYLHILRNMFLIFHTTPVRDKETA